MGNVQPTLGQRIRSLREAKSPKWTRDRFAELLGVTGTTVYRWENAQAWPEPEVLEKIASALGVEPWELLKPVDSTSTPSPTLDDLLALIKRLETENAELRKGSSIPEEISDIVAALKTAHPQELNFAREALGIPKKAIPKKKPGEVG